MGQTLRNCYQDLWIHFGQGYCLRCYSTTNIAVCMLEMKTPTSTSLMSSTPSSVNTTVSQLDSNTFPTWMSTKSRETLPMMSQYTLSEFVLDDLSKDSVSPPESPRNNVLELKSS